jgi:hypothetical protein
MAFLGDDGKMTRFGDVARVADWIVSHPQKVAPDKAAPASAPRVAKGGVPDGPAAPPVPFIPRSAQETAPEHTAPQPPPIATAPAAPTVALPVGVAAPPPEVPAAPAATPTPPTVATP